MSRLLLLEDDPVLSASLVDYLELEGFEVDLATRGEEAIDLSYEGRYHLYLLDVNVPEVDGFTLLEMLRHAEDTTPAIFITALSDIISVTRGFEVGADDYIKKPFDMDELIVRIRSKLRSGHHAYQIGTVSFDPSTETIRKEERVVDLGEVSTAVFALLITRLNQTVEKADFYAVMDHPSDQALRVHINKIKKNLDIEVINVRSVGYRLESL